RIAVHLLNWTVSSSRSSTAPFEESYDMTAQAHELTFDGGLLERGFWLYVWEITTPQDTHLYYVGRTGDSSSIKAQSPFNRMGQHLGFNKHANPLRRHLNGACLG